MTYVESAYGRLLKRFGGRPFRAEDVEKALGLRAGYVKNLLSELKRKGWISSTPDPEEARRTIYRLDLAAAGEVNASPVQSMLGQPVDGINCIFCQVVID